MNVCERRTNPFGGDAAMTPVRKWIVKSLRTMLKPGVTLWSDTNGADFYTLTGLTQKELMQKWYGGTGENPDHAKTGFDPGFTTCTSFMPRFATRVRQA